MQMNNYALALTFVLSVLMLALLVCINIIKADTALLILGNFAIAYWISIVINKKNRNEELHIKNCFDELDALLIRLCGLRKICNKDPESDNDILRILSLINLQIDLIEKYKFIDNKHTEKLKKQYNQLNTNLTDDPKNKDYNLNLLTLEKEILVIKSDILNK